ncbi:TPA: type 3 secretion system effector OspB, partial [Shigella flexneri]
MNLDGVRPYCRIGNKKNESISDIAFAHIIKRVKNSSCTHPKAALVFLGEKGFCDSNDVLSIMGQQIPRVFKNKMLYDYVFKNEKSKNDFLKMAESWLPQSEPIVINNDDDALNAAAYFSVKKAKIKTVNDTDFKEYNKVYILGHGSPGSHQLGLGSELIDVQTIISRMKDCGILNVKDIRFTSCGSADKVAPKNFNNAPAESLSCILNSLPFFKEKESLLEQIKKHLENDESLSDGLKISGYHGYGVHYGQELFPYSHYRSTSIP